MAGTTHRVTLVPGDGTGPELTEATRRVLEAAAATSGSSFDWDVQQAGVDIMEEAGTPLPPETLASIKRNKVAIKGPITTPIGTGFRSVNVALRAELELYACLRPCKTYPGVRSRFDDVDITIVRENTEDLYAGIEYESGTPEADQVIDYLNGLQKKQIRAKSGISIKPMSEFGSERIIRYAFEYARSAGRKRVHCIQKSNIMKFTDGLFLSVFREVAKDYPDIEPWENLVDATCMGLVQRPNEWDVLVLPNLYGDILSDLTAGMIGGLGVAPGANIGTDTAVFEATHGSAPKYKGQNKVNPTAMILSGKLMLEYLKEDEAAARLEAAVAQVIAEGKSVTYDMKPDRNDPTAVGTAEYADAIIEVLGERIMSREGKVTVVGSGFYGSTTAQRLAEFDIFDEVVLTDIVEGKPEGIALDISQSRSIEGFETKVVGVTTGSDGSGYERTADSDVVVITAGLPRKPGMSRMDLIETNAKIVRSVAENVAKFSPNAVVVVVSNPLDEMTALTSNVTGFPKARVVGQAGMLDTARFKQKVADQLGVPVSSVGAITLGSHGDTMVPVPSVATVDGKPLSEVLDPETVAELVKQTREGGAEIVALLKTGSAYYAPSAAAARMVKAIHEDLGEIMPVCAWVDGQYGIDGVYLGVPGRLGAGGVTEVVEMALSDDELADLRNAAEAVRAKQKDVESL